VQFTASAAVDGFLLDDVASFCRKIAFRLFLPGVRLQQVIPTPQTLPPPQSALVVQGWPQVQRQVLRNAVYPAGLAAPVEEGSGMTRTLLSVRSERKTVLIGAVDDCDPSLEEELAAAAKAAPVRIRVAIRSAPSSDLDFNMLQSPFV